MMGQRDPLQRSEIEEALESLKGWRFENDSLRKSFEFRDFREAMSFIVRVAFFAEDLDHHPEIRNVYNRVDLTLSTHDAGNRVTEMDLSLARSIEDFVWV